MKRGGKQMRPTTGRGGLFAEMMMALASTGADISGMMSRMMKTPRPGRKRRWNTPHQGTQEKARRVRQMAKGVICQDYSVTRRFAATGA